MKADIVWPGRHTTQRLVFAVIAGMGSNGHMPHSFGIPRAIMKCCDEPSQKVSCKYMWNDDLYEFLYMHYGSFFLIERFSTKRDQWFWGQETSWHNSLMTTYLIANWILLFLCRSHNSFVGMYWFLPLGRLYYVTNGTFSSRTFLDNIRISGNIYIFGMTLTKAHK